MFEKVFGGEKEEEKSAEEKLIDDTLKSVNEKIEADIEKVRKTSKEFKMLYDIRVRSQFLLIDKNLTLMFKSLLSPHLGILIFHHHYGLLLKQSKNQIPYPVDLTWSQVREILNSIISKDYEMKIEHKWAFLPGVWID